MKSIACLNRGGLGGLLILLSAMLGGSVAAAAELPFGPSTTLRYTQPARSWAHEALPIGNGRLGAMVFGKVGRERIALNEDTVWSGSRVNWNRKDAAQNLPKIRELLLAGKNAEAEAMVNRAFTCVGGGSRGGANGPWGCFQELGNLNIVWGSDVESVPLNKWKYKMIETPGMFLLDIAVPYQEHVLPMIPSGMTVRDLIRE